MTLNELFKHFIHNECFDMACLSVALTSSKRVLLGVSAKGQSHDEQFYEANLKWCSAACLQTFYLFNI